MKEYQTFVEHLDELQDGKELVLGIQDLTPGRRKYNRQIVKAKIYKSIDTVPGADVLWLRTLAGALHPKPWAIKIVEDLGISLPGYPYGEDIPQSMKK
jgi:hypothetical protein